MQNQAALGYTGNQPIYNGQAAQGYGAPQPSAGYGAPQSSQGYGAPQPSQGYGAPQQAPVYGNTYGQLQPEYSMPPQQVVQSNGPVLMGNTGSSAKPRSMEVIVPNGAFGGSVLQITDPETRTSFQVTVPQGLQPGMKFIVQLQQPSQQIPYQAPSQQPMAYQQQPPRQDNDDCGAFLMGMCFCCTLCCMMDR